MNFVPRPYLSFNKARNLARVAMAIISGITTHCTVFWLKGGSGKAGKFKFKGKGTWLKIQAALKA